MEKEYFEKKLLSVKDVENNQQIFKNYTKKISLKMVDDQNSKISSNDFNSMIVLFNWCFYTKNNFYVNGGLSPKSLQNTVRIYNQLKSNMLNDNERDLFGNLNVKDFKFLKFLLCQYINKYNTLTDDFEEVLKKVVSKKSIQNCVSQINIYIYAINENIQKTGINISQSKEN